MARKAAPLKKTAAEQRRAAGFKKGQSGNPNGRPKGVANKATRQIKEFCQQLFERPAFQKELLKQWDNLTLDSTYRILLTHYAFGKPPQALDINLTFDPAKYLADRTPEE